MKLQKANRPLTGELTVPGDKSISHRAVMLGALAEGDTEKIKSLMRVFRLAYRCVGIFVLVAGTALTPFLEIFVSEMPAEIPLTEIRWIYVLNVVNSGASYFFIYRASLLFADQKKYVETIITTVAKLAAAALQIGILLLTKNYFLYLGIMGLGWLALLAAVAAVCVYCVFQEKGMFFRCRWPEESLPAGREARLRELRRLCDQKLITQEEYERKRQEILKEL